MSQTDHDDHVALPLGATTRGGRTGFVVASTVAERIELCLFGSHGDETDRVELTPGGDGLWCTDVVGVGHGHQYGFRVHGPGDPANGHACDPAKLLVDPAARRIVGPLRWTPELLAPGVDSAPFVPRSVVIEPGPPVEASARPGTSWERTVVYETHVGQLTTRHPLVPVAERGHYPGLAAPAVVDHLHRLGVTAVELLPVHHFVSEHTLARDGRRNVWGYNPLVWGAPHAAYATQGGDPVAELRAAVAGLHEVGIEVWLDVVLNHTCEGSLGSGPILSLRGFDNLASYRLIPGSHGLVDDDVTGCGNAVDTRSPLVRRLIREMLVRWVREFGIDGFRFDLAATLIRGDDGPTADSGFLADLAAEPALEGVKLVAEPWDVGLGGYALGRFPSPWREWNDRYRDDVRDLWRGHAPWRVGAARLTGSADVFRHHGREANTSVNVVTTHDGFTLADLVTYDSPVNGGHGQRSWSGGLEGPTDDPTVVANRRSRQRALLGTLLCSQGVPLLLGGDELGRSQAGHADGYTLEPDEWGIPWPEADWDLAGWTTAAITFRHDHPVVRRSSWTDPDDGRVTWLQACGEEMDEAAWADDAQRALQVLFDANDVADDPVLLLFATAPGPVTFHLPAGTWQVELHSAWRRPLQIDDVDDVSGAYEVQGPAFVALVAA